MSTVRFVSCSGCHAEISDDRKTCPHCGADVVPALTALELAATDETQKGVVKQLVEAEREHDRLVGVVNYLKGENQRLQDENTELRRRTGADAPQPQAPTQPITGTSPAPTTGAAA